MLSGMIPLFENHEGWGSQRTVGQADLECIDPSSEEFVMRTLHFLRMTAMRVGEVVVRAVRHDPTLRKSRRVGQTDLECIDPSSEEFAMRTLHFLRMTAVWVGEVVEKAHECELSTTSG
jgi:hypothetical protein